MNPGEPEGTGAASEVPAPAPRVASLKEYDWDRQAFNQREYPAAPIEAFVDFFRTTKAWIGDPARVHREVQRMEKALATVREVEAEQSRKNAHKVEQGGGE